MAGTETKTLLWLGAIFLLVGGLVAYSIRSEKRAPPAPAGSTATTAFPPAAEKPEAPAAPATPPASGPQATPAAPAAPTAPADRWDECALDLPNGTGRLVLMRRPSPEKAGDYLRKVRIESPPAPQTAPLPKSAEADARMNVYWYPTEGNRGALVRLRDREGEFVVTLRSRTTVRMLRIKGEAYAGEVVEGEYGFGWAESPDGKIDASVGEQKAYRVRGRLADSPGQYLGRIEHAGPGLRFVGSAESPEESIGGSR